MIRVIIADDHQLFRDSLEYILENQCAVKVVASADNGADCLKFAQSVESDLIILDLNMPKSDGLSVIPQIKALSHKPKLLIVTSYKDQKIVKQAFKMGIDGIFFKQMGFADLKVAIDEVMDGEVYMPKGLAIFPKNKQAAPAINPLYKDEYKEIKSLTPRECEVLQLLSEAKAVKEIASELFISQETVSVHKKNIMKKLELKNVAGMVKYALEHDLKSFV